MQYCTRCNIYVHGNKSACPLCNGSLKGDSSPAVFPVLEKKKYNVISLLKIALFLYLSFLIVLLALIYLSGYSPWMFLALIIATMGIENIWLVMMNHNNPIKTYHFQIYATIILSFSFVRRMWLLEFLVSWIYPIAFVSLIVITFLLAKLLKFTLEDYVIYYMTATLLSLLQLIPIATGLNHFPLIAVICISGMVIFAIGVIIFHFKELQNAARKYLNI